MTPTIFRETVHWTVTTGASGLYLRSALTPEQVIELLTGSRDDRR